MASVEKIQVTPTEVAPEVGEYPSLGTSESSVAVNGVHRRNQLAELQALEQTWRDTPGLEVNPQF